MRIEFPEVKKTVEDYDILFTNGYLMPLTLDASLGDTIFFNDKMIKITLAARPIQSDPDKSTPAEDITVFMANVLSIRHCVREVVEPTPEEKAEYRKTWQEFTSHKTIQ